MDLNESVTPDPALTKYLQLPPPRSTAKYLPGRGIDFTNETDGQNTPLKKKPQAQGSTESRQVRKHILKKQQQRAEEAKKLDAQVL